MSNLKDAVIEYVRNFNAEAKAREYHQKKKSEMMKSRERLMHILTRGGPPEVMIIDNQVVVVEFGSNGVTVRPGRMSL